MSPRVRRRLRSTSLRPLASPPDVVWDGETRYELLRTWPRGREHALLELAAPDGDHVAAQWHADRTALADLAGRTPAPARVAGDVLLQPSGADGKLRVLPEMLAEPGARLVAHRPGRRAVVHVTSATEHYVKVVRRKAAEGLAHRARLVEELLDGRVTVPGLREDSDLARGVLRWTTVPGRTAHDLAAAGDWPVADARAAWRAAGRAITRLHGSLDRATRAAEEEAPELGRHGVEDELRAIAHWLDPAVAHGLLPGDVVARAGERVVAALEAPVDRPVLGLLHRDLHDKQLLVADDGTVGMIDVDTLAVGERAVDVANVLVHLELRRAQGLVAEDVAEAAASGFREGLAEGEEPADGGSLADVGSLADGGGGDDGGLYGEGALGEAMWSRVEAYARATRLRLAGVYAFRPRWRGVAEELLHAVATGERLATGPERAGTERAAGTSPRRWPAREPAGR